MNNEYYYIVASLPVINFESKLPLSSKAFLAECSHLLREKDSYLMQSIVGGGAPRVNNAMYNNWLEFNHNLKNELAWERAHKAHQDAVNHLHSERIIDIGIVDVVNRAMKQENSLEAERILDIARWEFLSELELNHYFDVERIIVFTLKLKILERYDRINSSAGKEIFEELKSKQIEKVKELVSAQAL